MGGCWNLNGVKEVSMCVLRNGGVAVTGDLYVQISKYIKDNGNQASHHQSALCIWKGRILELTM